MTDKRMNRWTDICDCRIAFTTENLSKIIKTLPSVCLALLVKLHENFWLPPSEQLFNTEYTQSRLYTDTSVLPIANCPLPTTNDQLPMNNSIIMWAWLKRSPLLFFITVKFASWTCLLKSIFWNLFTAVKQKPHTFGP